MKTLFKTIIFTIIIIIISSIQTTMGLSEKQEKSLTILFTHDMHDNLLPFKTNKEGVAKKIGGYSKLKYLIDTERNNSKNSILVDAGDYSMGTLFQSIYTTESPSLRTMGQIGYDVTTFGNHEYDFRPEGLSNSLNNAKKSGDKLPVIVQSNTEFPENNNEKMGFALEKLKKSMDDYGVKEYIVLNRNNIKIGVFGLMGKDAASNAPMAAVKFTDTISSAKRIVKILSDKEQVDLIVCLSHSGTSQDKKSKSEDEELAKKVPNIDVIISGHTHTELKEPIIVGKTLIASAGCYGENLGVIKLLKKNEKWILEDYKLKETSNFIPDNISVDDYINKFKDNVEENYLAKFHMKFNEKLAYSPFNFTTLSEISMENKENGLTNLITDSYIYAIKNIEGKDYEPITASLTFSGMIRNTFVKGDITVSDVFNVNSLGMGADKTCGYPLTTVYVTGQELKRICEADASISPYMNTAKIYMAGVRYKFNNNRLIFNRVTDAEIINEDGSINKIDDKKLYRVAIGLYPLQLISSINEKIFGLMPVVPKSKEGIPITDFEDYIIKDTSKGENTELKEWTAIASYIKSFESINGVPQIPEKYGSLQGRKTISDSYNIYELVKKPNKVTLAVYIIIIFIIIIIYKFKNNKSKKSSYK